jgi:alkaline phosphatase D
LLPENPHIRFFDSRKRGYVLNTLSREGWQAELRTVEDVTTPAARGSTLARFVIAAGRPGAQPA